MSVFALFYCVLCKKDPRGTSAPSRGLVSSAALLPGIETTFQRSSDTDEFSADSEAFRHSVAGRGDVLTL